MTSRRKKRRKRRTRWTAAHVRRLFWRAGFGASEDEARRWAARGRAATIAWLVGGDGPAKLVGPGPSANGKPLDRVNEHGHDVLWWLDRMVRTTRPLEEKLTLFWHDHFATRDQDTPLMLRQNETLREHALGDFAALLRAITLDPAMQGFLSLAGSHKDSPNENYARELMELFTIGSGYTENDIREAARALTGFVAVRSNGRTVGVDYDPARHDDGEKTIFGRTGRWGWEDVLRLCLEHPNHSGFLVDKLWAFFTGTPAPPAKTRRRLIAAYNESGRSIAPVVRRILASERLYDSLDRPDHVKWPVVLVAGQLRAMNAPVDRMAWLYLTASMGQRLFAPPSVAGWETGAAWMSSNAMRARFLVGHELVRNGARAAVPAGSVDPDLSADGHVAAALAAAGSPDVTRSTRLVLDRFARGWLAEPTASGSDTRARRRYAEELQRALRLLIIAGPDNQLC